MINIQVTDRQGATRFVECPEAKSLMHGLKGAGYEILAICGGMLSCGTCHVYVRPEDYDRLEPPSEMEIDLLEGEDSFRPGASRLSCQITATSRIDGLSLTLAPD